MRGSLVRPSSDLRGRVPALLERLPCVEARERRLLMTEPRMGRKLASKTKDRVDRGETQAYDLAAFKEFAPGVP